MNQAPFLSPCIFLFNYSQPVQVLLYFPSPYAALPSCFVFFYSELCIWPLSHFFLLGACPLLCSDLLAL